MRRFSATVDTRSHIPTQFVRLFATVVILALLGASANAAVTKCGNGQVLPAGDGGNLVVLGGVCTVNSGTYLYANVNIIAGGTLQFSDANIDFWAEFILVENTGSLIAGTTAAPIGTNGSRLIIHLWGADQGTSGTAQGIPCITPVMGSVGPCGIPMAIWTSNIASQLDPTSCKQNTLPGGVTTASTNTCRLTTTEGEIRQDISVTRYSLFPMGERYSCSAKRVRPTRLSILRAQAKAGVG